MTNIVKIVNLLQSNAPVNDILTMKFEMCMNFFQRLSYLKNWHDENHSLYSENRTEIKAAFSKKYKNELKKYTAESKRLKRKRAHDIITESSISYQDWVEKNFQKLLKELSQIVVEFKKIEILRNFDTWLKDFATLDYQFRVYSIELFYKVELARFNSQFDSYIIALREGHAEWLLSEDERFTQWEKNHPLYKELQEFEFQYDSLEDDDIVGQNISYNKKIRKPINKHKHQKMFTPAVKENISLQVKRPSVVRTYSPSYF